MNLVKTWRAPLRGAALYLCQLQICGGLSACVRLAKVLIGLDCGGLSGLPFVYTLRP